MSETVKDTKASLEGLVGKCDVLTEGFRKTLSDAQEALKVFKQESHGLPVIYSPDMANAVFDNTAEAMMSIIRGCNAAIACVWKLKEIAKLRIQTINANEK